MPSSPLAVLIVDDSPEDRLTLRRLLARAAPGAYTLSEAERGDRALAAVRLAPPDCVLLDQRLPDQDGLAVLAALRAFTDVPVVLFTGVGTETLAVDALQQGAQDYLVKGALTPERLHTTVQRAIATVRLVRERNQTLALLTTVLDTLPVGITVLDPELRILRINAALAELLGHPAAALLGQPLPACWPALAAPLAPPCARVLRGEPFRDLELCLPAADARDPRWLSFSGTPVPGADGASMLGLITAQDITARNHEEAALQRAAARLQILADASQAFAAAGTDVQAGLDRVARISAEPLEAGCVIRLREDDSPWLPAVTIYDPDPEVQTVVQEVFGRVPIHIDDRHPAAAVMRSGQPLLTPVIDLEAVRAVIAPELWPAFERVCPHSVITTPLRAHGQILGSLAFSRHRPGQPAFTTDDLTLAQDLADRAALAIRSARLYQAVQAARQAAAQALARLDAIVANAPNGIGYLDRELRYQLVNPALAALNGQTPEAHLGRTLAEVLPGLAPRLEPLVRQVLATGKAVRDLELHGRPCPRDGVAHDWLISYFPVPGPAGEVSGLGVTVVDITASKRVEDRLRRLQAVTASFAATQTLPEVSRVIMEEVGRTLRATAVGLRLVSAGRLMLKDAARSALIGEDTIRRYGSIPLTAHHPAADAARTGVALFHRGMADIVEHYPDLAEAARAIPAQANAHLPLARGEEVFGVLSLHWAEMHSWDEPEREFAQAVAHRVAVAYERARLYDAERDTRRRLEETTALLAAVLDHLPVGLALFDRDLRFERVNPRMAAINRIDPIRPLGYRMAELARADSPAQSMIADVEALMRQVIASGQGVYDQELAVPDGNDPADLRHVLASWFPVMVDGAVRLVGAAVLDITDRVRAEQALRHSEARLKLGIAVANFALAEVDYATQSIRLSPEAATLYGLGTVSITVPRAQVHATFHPDDRATLARLIDQSLRPDGDGWFAHEHRIIVPDGQVRWLVVQKQILFDRTARPARPASAILVAQDITARKAAEAALRASAARQALLLSLGDHIRDRGDPAMIMAAAAELLGTHLQVGRVGYAEVDAAVAALAVRVEWTADDLARPGGRVPFAAVGVELAAWYRAGRTWLITD
ncbi:MAG: PAS domain-containing protein, partial [Chloroflexales bacterium]|nr:PAS domain-containing protein [Chloroflexales bacterium]